MKDPVTYDMPPLARCAKAELWLIDPLDGEVAGPFTATDVVVVASGDVVYTAADGMRVLTNHVLIDHIEFGRPADFPEDRF